MMSQFFYGVAVSFVCLALPTLIFLVVFWLLGFFSPCPSCRSRLTSRHSSMLGTENKSTFKCHSCGFEETQRVDG
jgi:hypothetical protein